MENRKIDELVLELKNANEAYRQGNPIMTDREYDELEKQLSILDPVNEWFKRGVNDEIPKTRKVNLPFPMMSLNKVKTIEELIDWAKGYNSKFIITPKFDGLSVGFFTKQEKGSLNAFTRGNGQIGQDCSKHAEKIGKKVNAKVLEGISRYGFVRGEICFLNKDFDEFKKRHEDAKNSRNSATGLINGDFDENKIDDYSNLSILCYNYSDESLHSKEEQLQILNSAINDEKARVPYVVCTKEDLQKEDCKMTLLTLFNEWRQIYPMDGLVFDVDNAEERLKAGTYANGNLKCSIAYKDPDFTERAIVKVDHIELQLNREGIVTPVVEFTMPVNLSGADISRVNGINMQYIHDWGIFDGQFLQVVRSGEVIPKIVAVNGIAIPFREEYKTDKEYKKEYQEALQKRHEQMEYKVFAELIDASIWCCPFCHEELKWDSNHIQMYCPNEDCRERKLQSIVQFCKIVGIKGFGEEKIRQLFQFGKIKDIETMFCLKESDFIGLSGWAETSIKSFLNELNRIANENLPYAQLAHASGFFGGLGQKTIQMILDNADWEEDCVNVNVEELCKIEGVQEITAQQFQEGIHKYAESQLHILLKPSYIKTLVSGVGKYSGQIICFTGFRSEKLKVNIESNGGQVVDTLSKKVTMLVTKDNDSLSSKITKAKEWGIPVVCQEDFLSL